MSHKSNRNLAHECISIISQRMHGMKIIIPYGDSNQCQTLSMLVGCWLLAAFFALILISLTSRKILVYKSSWEHFLLYCVSSSFFKLWAFNKWGKSLLSQQNEATHSADHRCKGAKNRTTWLQLRVFLKLSSFFSCHTYTHTAHTQKETQHPLLHRWHTLQTPPQNMRCFFFSLLWCF